jgi:hypothetical protein
VTFGQRQRDDLYLGVEEAFEKMTPSDFHFHYSPRTATIEHKPTGSKFKVLEELNTAMAPFSLRWHVKDGPRSEPIGSHGTWEDVLEAVIFWAGEVKYVAEESDLWAELQTSQELLSGEDLDNTTFTLEQQAEIARRIEEVKAQAREAPELTAEQLAGIDQKLDDLRDASKRVKSKDWLVMLYGYAFGMIANDLVPAHVVQGLITSVITGLGHIFGLGGVPPFLPPTA